MSANRDSAKEFFNRKAKDLLNQSEDEHNNLFLFCALCSPLGQKTIEEMVLITYLTIEGYIDKGFIKIEEENVIPFLTLVWKTMKHNYPLGYIKQYEFLHIKETNFYSIVINTLKSILEGNTRNAKVAQKYIDRIK